MSDDVQPLHLRSEGFWTDNPPDVPASEWYARCTAGVLHDPQGESIVCLCGLDTKEWPDGLEAGDSSPVGHLPRVEGPPALAARGVHPTVPGEQVMEEVDRAGLDLPDGDPLGVDRDAGVTSDTHGVGAAPDPDGAVRVDDAGQVGEDERVHDVPLIRGGDVTPFYSDPWLTMYQGDCRSVMASLPAESVHCVISSPPYWGLRDYGIGEKGIGLEPTPEAYVESMVAVFREVRRVLRADGTVWLNLGDSYNQSGDGVLGRAGHNAVVAHTAANVQGRGLEVAGLKPKDLVGIPWRVAFALQADGWYLRSDIVWSKANPMPESVTDRPTKSHEYIFLLSKSPRYYFDNDAVREGLSDLPTDATAGRVPRAPEPFGRVISMPTMFGSEDDGLEGGQPGPGASEPAAMGRDGAGSGDQAAERYLGPEAGQDGRVPSEPGREGRERAVSQISAGSRETGEVLPRAADVDGWTVDPDRSGVGADQGRPAEPLPLLRPDSAADDGPRHPGEPGRDAHSGERGGSVPSVQQPETRQVKVPGGWDRGPGAHGTIHRDGRTSAEYQQAQLKAGRNLRSVWHLATQPYPGAHFATFPEKLVEPCILAGTSAKGVCPECGAPWVRESVASYDAQGRTTNGPRSTERRHESPGRDVRMVKSVETTGWHRSCGHEADPVPATIADPFAGSGTVGRVAARLSRRAVLIDLNADYLGQAMKRNQDIPLGLETAG